MSNILKPRSKEAELFPRGRTGGQTGMTTVKSLFAILRTRLKSQMFVRLLKSQFFGIKRA